MNNFTSSPGSNDTDISSLILHSGLGIRGNLAKVVASSEILLKEEVGPLNEQQRTLLETIQNSGKWLVKTLEAFTTLAHIKTGTPIITERVNLLKCFQEIEEILSQKIKAKGQSITVESANNLPPVSADFFQLGRVLFFLLENAHQYTPRDGQIKIIVQVLDNEVMVTVSDTGIGIASDDQEKVFNLLFRANNRVVMEQEGFGVGLYVAKYYIEYFGGKIGVESALGQGSKFWFTLPIATDE
jgi:signal transduction histidine kinase